MGEIADDVYVQGLNDYFDLSDEERVESDERAARDRAVIKERRAQWRRNNIRSHSTQSDDPPF